MGQVSENKLYEKTVGVGQSVSHKTMDALEAVGKKAMDVLLQQEVLLFRSLQGSNLYRLHSASPTLREL